MQKAEVCIKKINMRNLKFILLSVRTFKTTCFENSVTVKLYALLEDQLLRQQNA